MTHALQQICDGPPTRRATLTVVRDEALPRSPEQQLGAAERIAKALAHLRELGPPALLLERAACELCAHSDLDRIVLSRLHDGHMVVESTYFRDSPAEADAALAALREVPIRLEHPLIETDIMRRRRATIVTDALVHPHACRPLAEAMGWHAYVAAPIVVGRTTVGFLHADRPGGRPLDAFDAELLWSYADGFALIYERALLKARLRRQCEELQRIASWIDVRSSELADHLTELGPDDDGARRFAGAAPAVVDSVDDTAIDALLTRRELDVLRLVTDGQTNGTIASALFVSEATVKYHVRNILRKLNASNRAEAVSRYLRIQAARSARSTTHPHRRQ